MTIDNFIDQSKAYYGPYNKTQEAFVKAWLKKKPERTYSLILSEILKSLSPVYKTPPGIKELEDAYKEIMNHRKHEIPTETKLYLPVEEDMPKEQGEAILKDLYEKLSKKRFSDGGG